jgi:hypothetical protein
MGEPQGDQSLELGARDAIGMGRANVAHKLRIGWAPIGLIVRHPPQATHGAIHELRIEVAVEQNDAGLHIVECGAHHGEMVGLSDDVGDVSIAQHAPAVGQHGALEAQHLAAGQPEIARGRIACDDRLDALGDIGLEILSADLIGAGFAAVTHQRGEGGFGRRLGVREAPHLAKGAIDELRAQRGVEQHDSECDIVERGAQRQHFAADQFRVLGAVGRCRRGLLVLLRPFALFVMIGMRIVKLDADLIVRSPRHRTRMRRRFAVDFEIEALGNAGLADDFQTRAGRGKVSHQAFDNRLPVIERNSGGF